MAFCGKINIDCTAKSRFLLLRDFSLQDVAPKLAGSISKIGFWLEMLLCNPGILQNCSTPGLNDAATHAADEPKSCMEKPV
jgi:hypothetical protein